MIKTIFFDLDGTVLDTLNSIVQAGNTTLISMGHNPLPEEVYRDSIGYGRKTLIDKIGNNFNEFNRQQFEENYLNYFSEHQLVYSTVFPQIKEMLEILNNKNIKCIIVTNKDHKAAEAIIKHYLPNYFEEVIGIKEGIIPKPDPTTINNLLDKYNLKKEESLFVGDMTPDYKVSRNAGIKVCLVKWGYGNIEELESLKPDYFIDNPLQLIEIVEE